MSLTVKSPGMLSLIQDSGRFGYHSIGLTTGGPLDSEAFYWANRLLGNEADAAMIECTVGGLKLIANVDTVVAVTGAVVEVKIDGQPVEQWRGLSMRAGQALELGYAKEGCRCYVAVAGGLQVKQSFGSCSTVMREGIGGLDGDKLSAGTVLPIKPSGTTPLKRLPVDHRPRYHKSVTLRVVLGYQQALFSDLQKATFFSEPYKVSASCDRMGYRLEGAAIATNETALLSEGICLGAVQVPADGQPIVLINDRQTIGGYPKIGSVIGIDLYKLTQLMAGAEVFFSAISIEEAHNELHLAHCRREKIELLSIE
ncbi:biotin-dependent carboxylase-like uncharacterized protein [Sinobacterium caligoides]|uniref:Biotin-dependent carboxylase-like uncharacterized protein n=1 Tax=Sinobacterium caligoides TaxID=933926 RepID=A0A3N2DXP9_9GAMM|nr:biotin-dependent carboxyltransferase family protein [Sinobacterium caligoides]ROS04588.1 biotin-dependent carboxylase-like uncharacterized protein [Sinobacterium caligoides]